MIGSCFTKLRQIYTGGSNTKNCPLPSATAITRAKNKVNEYAENIILFKTFQCATGEGVKFDYVKYTNYILKAYSLEKIARDIGVVWALTHNGSLSTYKIMATHMVIKIVNLEALHPTTKSSIIFS